MKIQRIQVYANPIFRSSHFEILFHTDSSPEPVHTPENITSYILRISAPLPLLQETSPSSMTKNAFTPTNRNLKNLETKNRSFVIEKTYRA